MFCIKIWFFKPEGAGSWGGQGDLSDSAGHQVQWEHCWVQQAGGLRGVAKGGVHGGQGDCQEDNPRHKVWENTNQDLPLIWWLKQIIKTDFIQMLIPDFVNLKVYQRQNRLRHVMFSFLWSYICYLW